MYILLKIIFLDYVYELFDSMCMYIKMSIRIFSRIYRSLFTYPSLRTITLDRKLAIFLL
jgi:hypothetical protein